MGLKRLIKHWMLRLLNPTMINVNQPEITQPIVSMVSSMHDGINKTNEFISKFIQSMELNSASCWQQTPKRALIVVTDENRDEPASKKIKRAPNQGTK